MRPDLAPREPETLTLGAERFARSILRPSLSDNRLTLTISAPLSVLQTWAAFPQTPDQVIERDPLARWIDAANQWFPQQITTTQAAITHT